MSDCCCKESSSEGCCGESGCEDCDCSCCKGSGFQRKYLTKAERIEKLEQYKKELEKEIQGVQEEIDRLKAG